MYTVNETITTKKPHVCGSNQWKITKTGIDIMLECQGCKRVIMVPSYELDKKIKK